MSDDVTLSSDDVAKLIADPSGDHRAEAAEKVGAVFSSGKLTSKERELAEDIFRSMVQDAEVRVRQALSESLKHNPDIPHDVAADLAKDVIEVSAPILEFSEVLTDEDLIEIVRNHDEEHQVMVAKRKTVSTDVSDALSDTDSEKVVATLVQNEGAEISEQTYDKVITKFSSSEAVMEPLVDRPQLPIKVAERLVTAVSETIRQKLVAKHDLSPDMAMDLILETRERATLSLVPGSSGTMSVQHLVDQLAENDRLTPSLLLRSLCLGDQVLFEVGIAKLAGIPVPNAYILIHDKGGKGLSALFEKCHLSKNMLAVAHAALAAAEETDYNGLEGDKERFRQRMIERVLTQFEKEIDSENFDYLISKLSKLGDDQAA